jgi:zinc protease
MRWLRLVGLVVWLAGCTPPPGGTPAPAPAPTAADIVAPTEAAPTATAPVAPTPAAPVATATAQPTGAAVQTAPPPPLPVREFSLPPIAESTLENGLQLVVVPRQGLPYLSIQLALPGGQTTAPADLAGLPGITADLLTRGTRTRNAQEIARTIEQVGGSLSASAGGDALTVSASVLSEYTDLAFELLGDVTLNPTFPADELENQRQRALTTLQSTLANPSAVADRAFDAIVYGPHPYGRAPTDQSLRAIARDDVAAYYGAQLNPAGALLVVVGDITPEDALRQARATFGRWSAGAPAGAPTLPPPPERSGRAVYLVDRPGSTQAEVRIGHPGLPGASRERYAAQVANQVLGGGSTSRLFMNLREQKGYTYGIYSGFSFPSGVGDFTIAAAVRNEVVEPALREILAEAERLRTTPVPPEELSAARSYLIGSYAVGLQTSEALIGQIVSLKLRGLPLGDLRAYPQAIQGVDDAAVRQAARQHIRPDEAAIVVVGDAGRIRDSLAGIAPITAVDSDGRVQP